MNFKINPMIMIYETLINKWNIEDRTVHGHTDASSDQY